MGGVRPFLVSKGASDIRDGHVSIYRALEGWREVYPARGGASPGNLEGVQAHRQESATPATPAPHPPLASSCAPLRIASAAVGPSFRRRRFKLWPSPCQATTLVGWPR